MDELKESAEQLLKRVGEALRGDDTYSEEYITLEDVRTMLTICNLRQGQINGMQHLLESKVFPSITLLQKLFESSILHAFYIEAGDSGSNAYFMVADNGANNIIVINKEEIDLLKEMGQLEE